MQIFKPVTVLNLSLLLLSAFSFSSCNTDKEDEFVIPTTYTFLRNGNSTVAYEGQTARQDMLVLLNTYLKTSNAVGAAALDVDVLNNMFRNENDPFTGVTFTQNLRSKCFAPDVPMFEQVLSNIALASQATGIASDGVAGVLVTGSPDQNIGYRVNANGVELNQVFVTGLMGSVFFYQATDVYLTEERMGQVGNSDIVDGKNYTNMERYFDEAFGYFGIPTDFPSTVSLDEARFWGKYCNIRNGGLYPNINVEMSLNFRTARAAIAAKKYDVRDEFMRNILDKWAVIIAASAVADLSKGMSTSGAAVYERHHLLSRAIGFMLALKYHFDGGNSKYPPRYTYSNVENGLAVLNSTTNLYTISDTEIQNVINDIRGAFITGEIK